MNILKKIYKKNFKTDFETVLYKEFNIAFNNDNNIKHIG